MKRILAFVLILALALPLVACGGGTSLVQEETETFIRTTAEKTDPDAVTGEHDPTGFSAGFGRGKMTPTEPVPLAGYGNLDMRLSNRTLDDLYVTCVALSDGENKLLVLTSDMISTTSGMQKFAGNYAEKHLGVPADHVFLCATHTHSGPATSSDTGSWSKLFCEAVEKAMTDALADLDKTEVYVGSVLTENLNFVRRYINEDGSTSGDNYGRTDNRVAHESEADREMGIVEFRRANQKSIILVNWQAHPTITGGMSKHDISADYVGAFRKEAEKELDCRFAYFQGGAGNMNPRGSLPGETKYDVKTHGRKLYEALAEGLQNMEKAETGPILSTQTTITLENERSAPEGYTGEGAGEIMAAFNSGNTSLAKELCLKYGINSPYAISAYGARASRPKTEDVPIGAACAGDLGFVFAPYEMFDTTGRFIKDHSPFKRTIVCEVSMGSYSYMPTELAWDNGGYEVDQTHFVRGTAEKLGDAYVEMLTELKTKQ